MGADTNLAGMAVVGLSALLCGMLMARLKQPALVGYIIAGVLMGPSAFGVVENRDQISGLAELGILLLLFLIAIELSVRIFMVTWKMALISVALQICGSLAVIFLCALLLGFSSSEIVVLGFVVALSSTAVAFKLLEGNGKLGTRAGRVAIAILIGQDLAFLPMLLIVENLGGNGLDLIGFLQVSFSIVFLAFLVHTLNKRRVNLPFSRIVIADVDLSPLTGLVYCFGSGAFFGVIGLPPAYGAFLAGLVVGRSNQRKQIAHAVRPVQSILIMLFFLSVGLLIDLKFIWENLGTVLVLLLIVSLFKIALNIGIMRIMGEPWDRAAVEGLTLSQLGEFSFLLATTALTAGAIGTDQANLIISVTALSLAFSPFWLGGMRRLDNVTGKKIITYNDLIETLYGSEIKGFKNLLKRIIAYKYWFSTLSASGLFSAFHLLFRKNNKKINTVQTRKLLTTSSGKQNKNISSQKTPQVSNKETLEELGNQVRAAAQKSNTDITDDEDKNA
tara:strand:- start:2351 stop:3859 length:1509 start_codon:yes stop_codon:yes gene_type:complete